LTFLSPSLNISTVYIKKIDITMVDIKSDTEPARRDFHR